MNYSILIYENAAGFTLRTDRTKGQAYWAAWSAYSKALQDAGDGSQRHRAGVGAYSNDGSTP